MKNTRTRIKICGVTRPEDARCAAQHGADAIGLVFYTHSPRAIDVARAREILAVLPAFVTTVGLFVNPEAEEVERVLAELPLDCLQFHGDEPAAFCASFGRPYIKALRVKSGSDLAGAIQAYKDASGILVDSWHESLPGGTGETFDWRLLEPLGQQSRSLILAGGLNAENIAEAVSRIRPFAVDVSSGVESAPGIKSEQKIERFTDEVMRVRQAG